MKERKIFSPCEYIQEWVGVLLRINKFMEITNTAEYGDIFNRAIFVLLLCECIKIIISDKTYANHLKTYVDGLFFNYGHE